MLNFCRRSPPFLCFVFGKTPPATWTFSAAAAIPASPFRRQFCHRPPIRRRPPPSFPRRRESKMTTAKAKIKYKDSPFPRRRESHPKLAAKEIPAYAGMTAVGGKYKFIPPAALRRGVEIRKANFRGAERDGGKTPSIPAKSQRAALAKIRQTEKIHLTTPPPGNLRGQIATPLRQT
ncbi:MAG: hypothetical protein HAW59_06140, partial [Betaproteobacteria bacterium]|nr:hypothetical protein [Betaproteobacteria bacterium]